MEGGARLFFFFLPFPSSPVKIAIHWLLLCLRFAVLLGTPSVLRLTVHDGPRKALHRGDREQVRLRR